MKKKPTSNVELVQQLMEFSAHGALAQAFVIEALTKESARIAKLTDEEVAALDQHSPIHMPAWRAVAREIKAKMDEFYRS